MEQLTQKNAWKKLEKLAKRDNGANVEIKNHPKSAAHITLDYSGQQVNSTIMDTLFDLANECQLSEHIDALMSGKPINNTENRPALHTALRVPESERIWVNQQNIVPEVINARKQMYEISTKIRNKEWLGYSGKPITDVINIGIGGSMLGPFFCIHSLSDLVTNQLRFHFISDLDPQAFQRVTATLNPETTLFIISSKSFTTPETLAHYQQALKWVKVQQHLEKHFIAVTANVKKAQEMGFSTILPIWDWVGGRYSFFSAINLISCIAIGYDHFSEIIFGAHEMDIHFRTVNFADNLPVLLALLGIWNINFLNTNNLLLMTYAQDLQHFVSYLQQLDMESNGKSINKQGRKVDYATGPIIWGGLGNHAQHSYYQLLCQGTHKVAADLISVQTYEDNVINKICRAHKEVLTKGGNPTDNPHSDIAGQMPVNLLSLRDCSPKTLGSLISLYEHKIFVQGIIWNINSFDQPGVESSKEIIRQNKWIN
ncbi:glucose-6-phosphate isomerase [Legionella cincinnatiensis]|uniref:Glucose-6-phosphate isomerase n=1 Tax=Legionella cincinnatiensis TaxID=28085 RepID=A0A378IL31_9GAMM|nr:glucose-6-phosphate isomerase [Legionella cincinnatiensis]KTC88524.1 glucose-6-phosphate isomerase [Legionella cincinnatiensis]STX35987.1 glucose-6-phosphate isomerase [Legionella cincinnatiensis]